jgi:hypothetical protein
MPSVQMRKSIVILCIILFPTLVSGQFTHEQQFMQLLRVYERSQDSIIAIGNSEEKVVFLQKSAEKAVFLYKNIDFQGDTNLLCAATYLRDACEIFAWVGSVGATLVVAPNNKMVALDGELVALDSEMVAHNGEIVAKNNLKIEKYDSTAFPIKFKIMGSQISLRYENIKPDLYLYYDALGNYYLQQKNRKGLRYVEGCYKHLGDKKKADFWRRKRWKW